jgi:UDP-N-acetylglucosamine--N-acetylmuramyl-(pentapeptide) pyrophosphoryl-undecaprenol N-acetylglucosamine transferase
LTGNPLRKELRRVDRKEALEFFGLDTDKFTFLVMGGSQGSRHINEVLAESLHKIPDPSAFQVIHICGNKDYNYLNNKYKDLPVRVRLIAFLDKMEYAYSASNLVFSRSGATTVAELDYYNIPSIFVPYPFAYAHQYRNAQVLERKGRAVIVKDEDLSVDKLLDLISDSIKRKPGAALEIKEGVHSRGAVDSLVNLAVSLI